MKNTIAALTLTTLVACGSGPVPQVSSAAPSSGGNFAADINAFRASQGLGAIRTNVALTRAAQAHADDMAARNYFSHQSPGGPNGDTFVERAQSAGCVMTSGAENIASGQTSQAAVLVGWQNSPGHRRNMLVPDYTQYGLGRSGNVWVLKLAGSC